MEIEETNVSDFSLDIGGISCDSRMVGAGDAFVCLKGLKSDGHDYICEAAAGGASVIITGECTDFECSGPISYVRVANTREAYARMWYNRYFFFSKPRLRMIAITGTNGKTTTAHLLASIHTAAGYKTALLGTIGSTMTTPDPDALYPMLAEYDREYEFLVMEASSHALALDKLAPLKFELGVFTNLTPEHLDFHGTMNAYFAAKRKLFDMCGSAVVNLDDSWGALLWTLISPDVKKYSYSTFDDSADFTAKNIRLLGCGGVSFELLARSFSGSMAR